MTDRSSARGRGLRGARRGAGLWLALAGVGAVVGSCAQPRPYTRMLVVIDTDLQGGTEIDRIEFTTCPGGGDDACAVRAVLPLNEGAFDALLPGHPRRRFEIPGSIALEPTAGDDAPTQLRLVGRQGEAEVSRRVVRTHFVGGQTVVVPMFLARQCASLCPATGASTPRAVCRAGDPCAGGAVCEPAPAECGVAVDVPPRMLAADAGPDAEFVFAMREAGADATEPPPDTVVVDEPTRDAPDVADVMDVSDATDAMDAMDATDAMDAMDARDAMDASDVPDAMDARDAMVVSLDAADAADAVDAADVRDVLDADVLVAPDMGVADARDGGGADVVVCPPGQRGDCAEVCVDTSSDPLNCGGCETRCPAQANQYGRCVAGMCVPSAGTCAPGFADCDGRSDNGCEVDLRNDARNCGTCGNMCLAPSGAVALCLTGFASAPECTTACALGTAFVTGLGCVPAVGLVSPPAGAVLTGSRRPVFRWSLPMEGVSNLQISLCYGAVSAEGTCSGAASVQPASPGMSHTSSSALAPGVWAWRMTYTVSGSARATPWREFFLVTPPDSTATVSGVSNYRLDFDRDGRTDVVVPNQQAQGAVGSAAFEGANLARAYVYLGRDAPMGSLPGAAVQPNATLVAASRDVNFVVYGANAGDVNGDGYGDIVVGGFDSMLVFAGGARGPNVAPLSATRMSMSPTPPAITGLAPASDINADGYGDVGVTLDDGTVRVYYGSPHGLRDGAYLELRRGEMALSVGSLVGGFDANGDGFADLVAANGSAAFVYAWLSTGGPVSAATVPVDIVRSGEPGSASGEVADAIAAGDLNNDGMADLVIGYRLACPVPSMGGECVHDGRVVLRFGAPGSTAFSTYRELARAAAPAREEYGAFFGAPIATGTDLNGDGYLDLAVGARFADQVQFYLGQAGTTAPPPNLSLLVAGPGRAVDSIAFPATYSSTGRPMALVQVYGELVEGVLWYESGAGATVNLFDTNRGRAMSMLTTAGYAIGGPAILY